MVSLSNLPDIVLLLIIDQLGYDLDTHVYLSRVSRSLWTFYLRQFSEERWRRILAYNGLGRSLGDGERSFMELGCAVVHHKQKCQLCRTQSEDIRFQYFRCYDPQSLLQPLRREAVLGKDKLKIRPIEGIAFSPARPQKFASTTPSHAAAWVNLYNHPVPSERIRLSTPAMLQLQGLCQYDLSDGWSDSLQLGREEETQTMMQRDFRLDRHIFLSSLFCTTRPLVEFGLEAYFGNEGNAIGLDDYRGWPNSESVANPTGVTVLDLLTAVVDWEGCPWHAGLPASGIRLLPFDGLNWESDDASMVVIYRHERGRC